MSRDVSRRFAAVLLSLIVLYSITINAWFILADRRPCNINELSHIMGPVEFINEVAQIAAPVDPDNPGPERPSLYVAYLKAFNGYPPVGLVTSAFYGLFGRRHDAAVFSQLPFTLLLLLAGYGLGARLADRRTGLLAAWLLASAPATVEVSRQYLLELPLTAATALAVWCLLAADRFTNKKYSILAGLAVGLAALAKQTFFLFLLGPALYVLPGWLRAIRRETSPPSPERLSRRIARAAGAAVVGFGISWLLYGPHHHQAIEGWFAAYPAYQAPYGWFFLSATAGLLGVAIWLLLGRSTPLRNGLLCLLLAVFIASLWYFPKGVLNLVIYLNQMKMNIAQSGMSPATLLQFYRSHLTTYYLVKSTAYAMVAAAALLLMLLLAGKRLARWFYLHDLLPPRRAVFLPLLWFIIPFGAFFFITIQNEMNTVPLEPPLALLAALLVTRLRLPFAAKTRKARDAGRRLIAVRLLHGFVSALRLLLVTVLAIGGVLTVTPWPDGAGDYTLLPGRLNDQALVERWFQRKTTEIGYLDPRPADWHETEIADLLFADLPDVPEGEEPPRVLVMDQEFYFSYNTFWYLSKLLNKRAQVRSPWEADVDILNPQSPDYVERFEKIMYRTDYDEVYMEAKTHSDYQQYKNLQKGYHFLQHLPPESSIVARYTRLGSFELPDRLHSTVIVLGRKKTSD